MAGEPRPLLGLIAGVAAGVVASAAMAAFRAGTQQLIEHAEGEAVAVPEPDPRIQAAHYVAGGVIGGIYGVLSEYSADASTGFGTAYAVAASALVEGTLKPEGGGEPADAASHLVYGAVLEGLRWLIAGRR
ncbi:DUF1440 domain-containing protein [Sphingomonas sp.]|uniref:DUF1440 domain-containing protein n=1 Tax=Sphingomonas sp. TaxID=28214 RepID=UPI001B1CFD6B|nr:DUF1440 domain-containing protein [Sphingomonas sp.]MBO9712298.1 DUF1440 domain-containing protein [Sphingomonas sp.]